MVEDAWRAAGGKAKARQKLAAGTLSEDKAADLQEAMDDAVVPALEAQLLAPASAVGFIHPGKEVRLRYAAYPLPAVRAPARDCAASRQDGGGTG